MPKIAQYDTPEGLGLRPTEVGITATAAAARRVQGEYNEAAASQRETGRNIAETVQGIGNIAVRYAEHQELSTGMALGAQTLDNLTRSKDERISKLNPNSPLYSQQVEGTVQEWREKTLEPALEDFSKGFNTTRGQQWAQNFVNSTRESMFKETTADIAKASGVSATNNVRTTTNTNSNIAFRQPWRIDELIDTTKKNIATLASTLPIKGVESAKLQSTLQDASIRQLVKAGAAGAIQQAADPEAEAARLTGLYPEYINGHDAAILAQNARQQIRARDYDTRMNDARVKEGRKQLSSDARDEHLVQVYSKDPKIAGDPTAQSILNDPNLLPEHKSQLMALYVRQMKPETDARISARNTAKFLAELQPGEAKPEEFEKDFEKRIWAARVKEPGDPDSITESNFNMLRKELVDRKTPEGAALASQRSEFFKRYTPQIDPTQGLGGLEGEKMYQAQTDARRREADLRKMGKDPGLIYQPDSEYFFGKPENLAKYRPTMQEKAAYSAREKALSRRTGAEPEMSNKPAFVPPYNKGWQWSASTRQYLDPEGNIYNAAGQKVGHQKKPVQ